MSKISLLEACMQIEPNAEFNENNTVTIPMWVLDQIRDAIYKENEPKKRITGREKMRRDGRG